MLPFRSVIGVCVGIGVPTKKNEDLGRVSCVRSMAGSILSHAMVNPTEGRAHFLKRMVMSSHLFEKERETDREREKGSPYYGLSCYGTSQKRKEEFNIYVTKARVCVV